ncbi:hypothetical protein TNCV_1808361 [Trichonephila clavipes]|nr:hypothetical protein TNCV_1808361 [Trichonephila clavipes]
MPDSEIIAAVTVNEKMTENDEDVNVEDTLQTPKISRSEGLKSVETTLRYFEQGAMITDLLFLHHLRNKATKRNVVYGRQQDIPHFFPKKK